MLKHTENQLESYSNLLFTTLWCNFSYYTVTAGHPTTPPPHKKKPKKKRPRTHAHTYTHTSHARGTMSAGMTVGELTALAAQIVKETYPAMYADWTKVEPASAEIEDLLAQQREAHRRIQSLSWDEHVSGGKPPLARAGGKAAMFNPVPEPVPEPVPDPVEPVAEPVVDPVEPVVDPVEPVADPVEPVVEPVVESVDEPVVEPVDEPVEPVDEAEEEAPAQKRLRQLLVREILCLDDYLCHHHAIRVFCCGGIDVPAWERAKHEGIKLRVPQSILNDENFVENPWEFMELLDECDGPVEPVTEPVEPVTEPVEEPVEPVGEVELVDEPVVEPVAELVDEPAGEAEGRPVGPVDEPVDDAEPGEKETQNSDNSDSQSDSDSESDREEISVEQVEDADGNEFYWDSDTRKLYDPCSGDEVDSETYAIHESNTMDTVVIFGETLLMLENQKSYLRRLRAGGERAACDMHMAELNRTYAVVVEWMDENQEKAAILLARTKARDGITGEAEAGEIETKEAEAGEAEEGEAREEKTRCYDCGICEDCKEWNTDDEDEEAEAKDFVDNQAAALYTQGLVNGFKEQLEGQLASMKKAVSKEIKTMKTCGADHWTRVEKNGGVMFHSAYGDAWLVDQKFIEETVETWAKLVGKGDNAVQEFMRSYNRWAKGTLTRLTKAKAACIERLGL